MSLLKKDRQSLFALPQHHKIMIKWQSTNRKEPVFISSVRLENHGNGDIGGDNRRSRSRILSRHHNRHSSVTDIHNSVNENKGKRKGQNNDIDNGKSSSRAKSCSRNKQALQLNRRKMQEAPKELKYSRNDLDSDKSSQIVTDKSCVDNTSDKDILMGSQQNSDHKGNRIYRKAVRKFQQQFEGDTTQAAQAIIDHIHSVIGGRFLKIISRNQWFVVSDAEVMVKVYKVVADMKRSDEKAHNAAIAIAIATTTSRKSPRDRAFARQLEKARTSLEQESAMP
jgi:hypothetical protein